MFIKPIKNIATAALLSLCFLQVAAQQVQEPTKVPEDWNQPYEPFRIAGNLFYVGTYDLACYLIATSEGNILINTGLAASYDQIKNNIEKLGFRFGDIKILLTTQSHYDHLGAMADIKKATGAKMMVDDKDADVMKSGGSSDYALGGKGSTYKPIIPDSLLHDGDTISLGENKLVMLHHPGHTKGSCSFLLTVKDESRAYKVLIANMPTIVTDKHFDEVTSYPEIAADYAYTLGAMRKLSFDIWVASHASQIDLHEKHKPGNPYNPAAFMNKAGYIKYLLELQRDYNKKIKEDAAKK